MREVLLKSKDRECYIKGAAIMEKYCLGIDLGGTTTKFGLFDIDGNLHRKWQITTDVSESGKYILKNIAESLKITCENLQIKNEQISGVGMGVPGLVTENGNVTDAANLGWDNKNVVDELSDLLNLPVVAGNDANVAALGEMWKGSGIGYKNLVMLTLGTGIGGGIIVNEKIVTGLFGAGGEIGHIPIVYDETSPCACGRTGCLEQVASATGIIKTAKRLLIESTEESLLRHQEQITVPIIFEAAKSGDYIALKVVERAGRFLGLALATITGILDPEVYIIGGGVSNAGTYLLNIIIKHYRENVLHACRDTKIRLASLGNDAGIYGAARMVLKMVSGTVNKL